MLSGPLVICENFTLWTKKKIIVCFRLTNELTEDNNDNTEGVANQIKLNQSL